MGEPNPADPQIEARLLLEIEDLDSRSDVSAQFCYICHCTTWIEEDDAH